MNTLNPKELFQRIADDIPHSLHQYVFVTGSLAAAYHYDARLKGRGINTKDADLVIHPAGNTTSCGIMAEKLRGIGWRNHSECYPRTTAEPNDVLRAIRLWPPGSNEYFIEFLNIPEPDQVKPRQWVPLQLEDGWYGLPSFRYIGVTTIGRVASSSGLEYAHPAMMALANLLSHPQLGTARIETGEMARILRSAKDLGRVLALAWLEGRDGTLAWQESWISAMKECFPKSWPKLARGLGTGLKELLEDMNAMQEAHTTTEIGLLRGQKVTAAMLRITGERLIEDVIDPIATEMEKS